MKSGSGEWLSIEDLMEKISNKSAQERKMSQANHLSYSARMRGRSKQPIYTSDKRAKFTQKENKKWVRFVTVLGYIISVSLPALSLSFYYIYVWDPKIERSSDNTTILAAKTEPVGKINKILIQNMNDSGKSKQKRNVEEKLDLNKILSDGLSSMESRENFR
ncbi:unnamed protein product [Caenorhabditis angaria]|uniref:Uncharacterized protein n=1 Tax=Caenorhabditis angaria TaxID=860376 RepID=A0A9P1N6V4_9PELO|nr:unnamed protein product [Caenorhabditis angaria]